jgi:hypothetical protein
MAYQLVESIVGKYHLEHHTFILLNPSNFRNNIKKNLKKGI